ncbi:hypothetical protein ACJX0J_038857, partial [Zea mays]
MVKASSEQNYMTARSRGQQYRICIFAFSNKVHFSFTPFARSDGMHRTVATSILYHQCAIRFILF